LNQRIAAWLLIALAAIGQGRAAAQGVGRGEETFFASYMERTLKAEGIPGAAVALVRDGAVAYARGFGRAVGRDGEPGAAVDPALTPFNLGSTGKLLTWAAVLSLVERGKLELDADLDSYLGFALPDGPGGPLTMRMLMTHTAGFAESYGALYLPGPEAWRPLEATLKATTPARAYPAGRVMAYSNWGTALAGYVVERLAGRPFDAYIRDTFLTPLGMSRTRAAAAQEGGEWPAALPCAPIAGPVTDMARFLAAVLGGPGAPRLPLSEASREALLTPAFERAPGQGGMSLGLIRSTMNGRSVLWHLGRTPSYAALIALLPDEGVALVASFNRAPSDEGRGLLYAFMDEFYPDEGTRAAPTAATGACARVVPGLYASARVAAAGPARLLRYLGALRLRNLTGPLAGAVALGSWRFDASGAAPYPQLGGHRRLLAWELDGRPWISVGPIDYFKLAWFEDPWLLAAVGASGLGLAFFGLATTAIRRRAPAAGARLGFCAANALYWVYGAAGLAYAFVKLAGFGANFVYPEAAMALVSWLFAAWPAGAVALAASALGRGLEVRSALELSMAALAFAGCAAAWAAGLIA
jgi:CubicO group peptidase (beta-lactamase class C family)